MRALRKHWWWLAALVLLCMAWLLMPRRAGGQNPSAAPSSDEPRSYEGPFTWTQKRMGFGATIQGTLKLRVLPAAGTFTCFLSGNGPLSGNLQVGPSNTRMEGQVRMAAGTCSGTWNPKTGELKGVAQLRTTTTGRAIVDTNAGGQKQHHEQPLDASSSDPLTLRGMTDGSTAHGVATYAKGGSFTWTTQQTGGAAASAQPTQPTQPIPPTPPSQPPTQPQLPGKPSGPMPPKVAGAKAKADQAKQTLGQAMAPIKAQAPAPDAFDEAAGKGIDEATKAGVKTGLEIVDASIKKNGWSEAPGPGSKAFDAYDKLNKAKEALTDVDEVRKSIKALEAKVKAGEIRGDHGKILKGTVILGKGLKLVVDKVPVVGWAGAEVVDKTFGVVVKVGSGFAKTTSTWDCCTDDPAADCCE